MYFEFRPLPSDVAKMSGIKTGDIRVTIVLHADPIDILLLTYLVLKYISGLDIATVFVVPLTFVAGSRQFGVSTDRFINRQQLNIEPSLCQKQSTSAKVNSRLMLLPGMSWYETDNKVYCVLCFQSEYYNIVSFNGDNWFEVSINSCFPTNTTR